MLTQFAILRCLNIFDGFWLTEALSLNSNLPDELSLINCPPLSANNLFPASTGSGYGNNMFISTSNPPSAENQNSWVGPQKVTADRVLLADHGASTNFQMPKSLNKMDPRLQTDSPSFTFGNGSIHHQMNAFSPSPTLVDGLGASKVQAMVGQKRPFNSSVQSSQPTTHMLPLVPLSGMNPVRVMSLNTAKDSGGMFSYSVKRFFVLFYMFYFFVMFFNVVYFELFFCCKYFFYNFYLQV